jgi:ABC-type transporter Mla subunit MlaD
MSEQHETPGHEPGDDEIQEAPRDAAANIGGTLGRLFRAARRSASPGPERDHLIEQARAAVDSARPQVERAAQQARAAAEAARPHVERAARQAVQYTRDHQDQIRHVAAVGAIEASRRVVPPSLRPIATVVEGELLRSKRITMTPKGGPNEPSAATGEVPPAATETGAERADT